MPTLLVGTLGGVAIGLGGAPFEAQGVALVGVMLVYAALRTQSALEGRSPLRHAMLLGLAVGFAANATTCAWVSDLLHSYAFMPWPVAWLVASLLFLAQSLPFVVAALLTRALGTQIFPLAVVASSSAMPMIFPWRIGISQMGFLPFVQLAELGGLALVDFALALLAMLLVEALMHARPRARAASLSSAVLLFAGIAFWGTARIDEVQQMRASQPVLRVGLVQHNIDIPARMQPELWPMQMESTWSLTRTLEAAHVDVVMWPESAFPWFVDRYALAQLPSDMALESEGVEGPILFGASSWASQEERYNTVLLVTRTRFLGLVDKTRLMPFSERIPLWRWLIFLHPFIGPGLSEGPVEGGTLRIPLRGDRDAVAGILNCYEDLMDDHVQRVARQSPDFLSNHTNDAWFGPTRAPTLHHFLARMRAIETRRDVVRTVNTGVSGHISATGESLMTTEPFTTQTRIAEVRLARGMTLWVWLGDWVTPLCFVWLLGAVWNRRRSARRP
jgi:apolipoprotein N-acyltransferase